jgi:hypothetical protein
LAEKGSIGFLLSYTCWNISALFCRWPGVKHLRRKQPGHGRREEEAGSGLRRGEGGKKETELVVNII